MSSDWRHLPTVGYTRTPNKQTVQNTSHDGKEESSSHSHDHRTKVVQVSAQSLAYPILIALFLKDAFPWLVCWGWCLTLELISVTHEPSRVLDKSLECPWPGKSLECPCGVLLGTAVVSSGLIVPGGELSE